MRNKGTKAVRHVTINGELTLTRRAYWSKARGTVYPADALLGITQGAVSVGVRERCCQEAVSYTHLTLPTN